MGQVIIMKARRGKLIAATLVALLAGPALIAAQPAPDRTKAGVDAWESGDYAKAVGIWRPLAAAGDADAQFNLAQAHRLGRGVAVDETTARGWYLKAAQQNHPQAQANYGLLLFQKGERAGAMPWLQKAAERGDPRAQYVVGTALFNGDNLPKDWTRAYALMTRAAAAGLPPAVNSLAEMDKYVPLQQRQQGTTMARELERSAALANANPAPAPKPAVAAKPAQVAQPAPVAKPVAIAPPVRVAAAQPAPQPVKADPVRSEPQPVRTEAKPAAAKAKSVRVAVPAPVDTSTPVAGGGWRIQLGAFSEPGKAKGLWSRLAAKSALSGKQSYLVKAGPVTRLQAGPFASRAAADKACAAIRSGDQGCFSAKGI